MVDINSLTPVVRELYEYICKLNAQGKNCTFKSLKEQMPNHSHRDYTLALDLFKDQQAFIENNAMPMPPELKSQVDSMVTFGRFTVPALYGRGWWISAHCSAKIARAFKLSCRLAYKDYVFMEKQSRKPAVLEARISLVTNF